MKLVYFGQDAWEEAYMKERIPGVDMVFTLGTAQDSTTSYEDAEVLSVFVNSHVGATEMDRYPNLKLIATRSTGFDHIDMNEARARGIVVSSVPSYGVNTVAEFAFALILALSRRVCDAHTQMMTSGSLEQKNLVGFDLDKKTIGLVGCGKIGIYAAKMAKGFGMDVLVYDMRQDEELAKTYGLTYTTLEDLLSRSDIVSLHVPYNEHTHHLINEKTLRLFKKEALLVNTARGAVVDTKALVQALKDDTLLGAGLDVLEDEGDMSKKSADGNLNPMSDAVRELVQLNKYLIQHPRVIVTPHIAFNTGEAIRRILNTTADNIAVYQKGTPANVVTL